MGADAAVRWWRVRPCLIALGALVAFLAGCSNGATTNRLDALETRIADLEAKPAQIVERRVDINVIREGEVRRWAHGRQCDSEASRALIYGSVPVWTACKLMISTSDRTYEVTVPDACYQAVRVGDSWPSDLEECL